jgi:nucleoside-diphosphate-sugar epimerase
MKVAVTGSNGRIGRAVVEALQDKGHSVVAIDQNSVGSSSGVDFHQSKLDSLAELDQILTGIDAVIHLAAIPSPIDERQVEVFENNVNSAFKVFSAAVHNNVKTVVYCSSLSIYGLAFSPINSGPQYFPVDVEHPFEHRESYALSKEVNESSAAMWAARSQTNFIGFRFPYTHSMEEIEKFAAGEEGNDASIPGSKTKILWGYLDIRDAAEVLILAAEKPVNGANIFIVTAADTFMREPTLELIKKYYPGSTVRGDLSGHKTPFDRSKWINLYGYRPRYNLDRGKIFGQH